MMLNRKWKKREYGGGGLQDLPVWHGVILAYITIDKHKVKFAPEENIS